MDQDLRDKITQTATKVEGIEEDITEIKESLKPFGAMIVKHEVKLNKLPEEVKKNTDDIADIKWVAPTVKGMVGAVVTVFVLIFRQFLAGK